MDGAVGHRETASSRVTPRAGATSAHSHRFHHVRCSSGSSSTPQTSSFLHERIQQRRAEKGLSERNIVISSGGSRQREDVTGNSPARWSTNGTARRARSNSVEHEVNGMGVKETERTIETLKKQNWDFKLELYHRRERQTALEDEVKMLRDEHANILAQNTETMKLYDDLVQELDRRDKALFEAIDMIVDLQSTVEGLERGDATPRNIQTGFQDTSMRVQINNSQDQAAVPMIHGPASPRLQSGTEGPGPGDDWKTLERMSSFLQEHGERTPNLREMVLNNKRSFLHMRKISEASAVPSEMHRNASPSLSVLSESSFLSVYGSSNRTPEQQPSLPQLQDSESASRAANQGAGTDNASRPSTSIQRKLTPPTPAMSRIKIRTKQEKREALRNVVTSSPNARDFAYARMLPPTPDTTSSSVLRRYQNSDDTLSGERRITPPSTAANDAKPVPSKLSSNVARGNSSQPAPSPATTVRKDLLGPPIGYGAPTNSRPIDRTMPQRPQSACETTISRQRADSFELDSDSESEGGADGHSKASELDYWMRESNKPNTKTPGSGGVSPDLFSFPNESGRWDTDAIFGAMRGAGFMGSPVPDLKRDPVDEIPGALIAPENGILEPFDPEARDGGIPAPARRSSRHARTRSISSSTASPESLQARRDAIKARNSMQATTGTRRNSLCSINVRSPIGPQADYQADGAGGAKRSHYPPIVSQPMRQRVPGALNRLFRRSIGSHQDVQGMPSSEPRPQSQQQLSHPQLRRDQATGMKSVPRPSSALCWRAPTTLLQDELTSATPPPILRKRAHFADAATDGGDGANDEQYIDAASNTNTPGAGRRKWLSLGSRNSLTSRTG